MADCMECDDDIDWDVDVCPHCGLDAPVARKWYVNLYEEKVNMSEESRRSESTCSIVLASIL